MNELNQIRVTWQLATLLCSLVFVPIAAIPLASVLLEPGQRGSHGVKLVCSTIILAGLLLSSLAIRSRLAWVSDPGERRAILRQLALGALILAAAAALTAISYFLLSPTPDSHWYLIPIGLYTAGLVLIGKAMVPTDD